MKASEVLEAVVPKSTGTVEVRGIKMKVRGMSGYVLSVWANATKHAARLVEDIGLENMTEEDHLSVVEDVVSLPIEVNPFPRLIQHCFINPRFNKKDALALFESLDLEEITEIFSVVMDCTEFAFEDDEGEELDDLGKS